MAIYTEVPQGRKKGWLKRNEKRAWLASLPKGTPFRYSDYEPMPRDIIKPREWLQIEDQNGFGSCQGHALSTVTEIAYWLATGGDITQLSRWYAYVATQREDGIRGDQGSTISGGARLVEKYGICPEEVYPYPQGRYTNRITQAQDAAAAPYKLQTFRVMETVADVRKWLDAGLGAISIGVRWGRGGGHAIAIVQTDGTDFIFANSWGTAWGEDGYGRWTESEMRNLLRDNYTVAIGMTDMPEAKPRELNWDFFK